MGHPLLLIELLRRGCAAGLLIALAAHGATGDSPKLRPSTMAELLSASKPADWHPLDPENTLYLQFAAGRIVIELAPAFAPQHVANVKALAREHYFDGLAIVR